VVDQVVAFQEDMILVEMELQIIEIILRLEEEIVHQTELEILIKDPLEPTTL
jgi:hypothetical protein